MTPRRIKLYRTAAEWEIIRDRIKETGKSELNAYIRSEINKIMIKYNECPLCVTPAKGNKKQKVYCINPEAYEMFQEISKKMGKPVASIIDDFIIAPLLIPS